MSKLRSALKDSQASKVSHTQHKLGLLAITHVSDKKDSSLPRTRSL